MDSLLSERQHSCDARDFLLSDMEHLRRGLERRLCDLHSRTCRGGSAENAAATSARVWEASGELQRGLRAFEVALMNLTGEWDKEKRRMATGAEERMQRRLWVDFQDNPKVKNTQITPLENAR